MQIVGSELARDSEVGIARERASYNAVPEKKIHNSPLVIDRGQFAGQMANAI